MSGEALRVARVVVSRFIFDEVEAAENLEESSNLGAAWEREKYLKKQILSFKVRQLLEIITISCAKRQKSEMIIV